MDLISELKALTSFDIDRYGETTLYESRELVHGDYLNTDDVLALVKKYGWHDVSDPPTKNDIYQVTVLDSETNTLTVEQTAYFTGMPWLGWEIKGVVAWTYLFDPYKKEE